jgi:Xaa-Pro dipeptidase
VSTEVLPDDAELCLARRERVLAEMEAAGVDVLVVGREANARFISGAPRLWLAGTRPFGPGCVLVRQTGAVHLMSTWDEGVPEDIPHEHLYGISFNAANFVRVLREIDGAATARTVATDALNPSAERLLPQSFPQARLVDGDQLLGRARRVKTEREIDAIRSAVEVAELSVAAAVAALRPGITERQLTGVFMEAMGDAGVTTPSTQDVVWIASREHPGRRVGRDTPIAAGDLVAFEGGVIRNGYVGEIGRTETTGPEEANRELSERRGEVWRRLLDACRPGAPLAGLLAAYDAAGESAPPMPVARGLGLGFDEPLVTRDLPGTAAGVCFETGMVLALTAYVWREGVGGVYGLAPVVITDDGPELLSTTPDIDP